MKRIVIMPTFAEAHIVKFQVHNIVDTLSPDVVIYNEGLFPSGPESKNNITDEFKQKYCYKNTSQAFDTLELQHIIKDANEQYPDVKFIYNAMDFPLGITASEAYTLAVSNWEDLGVDVNDGDIIFPYEPDVFHLESASTEIDEYIKQLKPNTGFKSLWVDILHTPNYTERINNPFKGKKWGRKIAINYGGMEFYKNVVMQCETQNYNMMYPTDLITYHYNWFRPKEYRDMRYSQIRREDYYWEQFEYGFMEMEYNTSNGITDDVVVRPSKTNEHRYADYIDIEHPSAIKKHPNYIK
jgi:hypothetical protein